MIWNVEVRVVELVEAETEAEAITKLSLALEDDQWNTVGGDAFESEPVDPDQVRL